MLPVVLVLLLLLAEAETTTPATIDSCGGDFIFSQLVITPQTPLAGAPCNVSGVGSLASMPVQASGPGTAYAILFGATVFSAPVSACGPTNIDILGMASLDILGLDCPLSVGAAATVSLALTIPSIASGMGQIGFIVNTTSTTSGSIAWCLNLTAFF